MSSGTGPDSQIYRTADGGQTWTLVFQNTEPNAFYDCMTFFNRKVGLAVSDPPDGLKFRIIKTTDGGRTWNVVDPAGMPDALPGEFAFAASGQCLTSNHGHTAWFGSGGSAQARVFTSRNRGRTWTVSATPLNSGPTVGHQRAGVQEPAARPRRRRRLRTRRPRRRTTSPRLATAARPGTCSPAPRPSTAPARRGSTATRRSPSACPAATSAGTAAAPGRASTTAASTPSTARIRTPAGPSGAERPRRLPHSLASATASISTSWPG